jgi:hypothetical protein
MSVTLLFLINESLLLQKNIIKKNQPLYLMHVRVYRLYQMNLI